MNNVLGVRAIDQSPLQRGMDSRLGARHRRTFSLASAVMTGARGHDGWRRQESGQVLDPSRLRRTFSAGPRDDTKGGGAFGELSTSGPSWGWIPVSGVGDDGGGRVWMGDE